jgi:hypothetical protein
VKAPTDGGHLTIPAILRRIAGDEELLFLVATIAVLILTGYGL